MKGLISLSSKWAHRARVVEQVTAGTVTLEEASRFMRISYRQAKRVHRRWRRFWKLDVSDRYSGEFHVASPDRGRVHGILAERGVPGARP